MNHVDNDGKVLVIFSSHYQHNILMEKLAAVGLHPKVLEGKYKGVREASYMLVGEQEEHGITHHYTDAQADLMEDIMQHQESVLILSPLQAGHGARKAVLVYNDEVSDKEPEELGWFVHSIQEPDVDCFTFDPSTNLYWRTVAA